MYNKKIMGGREGHKENVYPGRQNLKYATSLVDIISSIEYDGTLVIHMEWDSVRAVLDFRA